MEIFSELNTCLKARSKWRLRLYNSDNFSRLSYEFVVLYPFWSDGSFLELSNCVAVCLVHVFSVKEFAQAYQFDSIGFGVTRTPVERGLARVKLVRKTCTRSAKCRLSNYKYYFFQSKWKLLGVACKIIITQLYFQKFKLFSNKSQIQFHFQQKSNPTSFPTKVTRNVAVEVKIPKPWRIIHLSVKIERIRLLHMRR